MVERVMADFPKDSSLGISMDIFKINTLKAHTEPDTVRGRPTLRCQAFSEQVGPRTRFTMGSLFVKQRNLQNAVFYEYEDRFAKIAKMSSFSEWIVDPHKSISGKLAKCA